MLFLQCHLHFPGRGQRSQAAADGIGQEASYYYIMASVVCIEHVPLQVPLRLGLLPGGLQGGHAQGDRGHGTQVLHTLFYLCLSVYFNGVSVNRSLFLMIHANVARLLSKSEL